MKNDLVSLKITSRDLENLTGFEVSEIFIGGVLGGVYRPTIFKIPKRLTYFCLTELIVTIITFIFSLPFGLIFVRNHANTIAQLSVIFQFLQITLGITFIVIISWNLYMKLKVKYLKTLVYLLDEVDKYNQVIQAVDVLDKLKAVGNLQVSRINREQVLKALNLARSNLVCGLRTEKNLRENRNILARRYELFVNIENNLATLRTLEVNNQANEYAQLLNEAFQIGMRVYQEVQKLS